MVDPPPRARAIAPLLLLLLLLLQLPPGARSRETAVVSLDRRHVAVRVRDGAAVAVFAVAADDAEEDGPPVVADDAGEPPVAEVPHDGALAAFAVSARRGVVVVSDGASVRPYHLDGDPIGDGVDGPPEGLESVALMFFPDPDDAERLVLADGVAEDSAAVFSDLGFAKTERWSGTVRDLLDRFLVCHSFNAHLVQASLEDAPGGSRAGSAVAIGGDGGDVVAVGAPGFRPGGRVRVYRRTAGAQTKWEPHGRKGNIFPRDDAPERLGATLALSGDGSTVAVAVARTDGGRARVRVHRVLGGEWVPVGPDVVDAWRSEVAALALSRDGSRLAVGDVVVGGRVGRAMVYEYGIPDDRSPWDWDPSVEARWYLLGGEDDMRGGPSYGRAIDLDAGGGRVAVGEPLAKLGRGPFDGADADAGVARVYELTGDAWRPLGKDVEGDRGGDRSGAAVALSDDGSVLAIGAPGHSDDGPDCAGGDDCGRVRVFSGRERWPRSGDLPPYYQWSQIGPDVVGDVSGGRLGSSVDLSADGAAVAVGAPGPAADGDGTGTATVWRFLGLRWVAWHAFRGRGADGFGASVGLAGDAATAVVGAPDDDAAGDGSGRARVFVACD